MITLWQAFNFACAMGAGACIGWYGTLGMPALIIRFVNFVVGLAQDIRCLINARH